MQNIFIPSQYSFETSYFGTTTNKVIYLHYLPLVSPVAHVPLITHNSQQKLQENTKLCANCGGHGHIYKQCNHPITSFGVICFRMVYNYRTNTYLPQYLMVQRKDSLSYVEFLRGKYNCDQYTYLLKLFSNMTEQERHNILTVEFDRLWKQLWQVQDCSTYVREYNESKVKFGMLKRGYHLKTQDQTVMFVNFEYILQNSKSNLPFTEWGFPKGRRNINEDDISCAFREFQEETGLSNKDVNYLQDLKPFEEVFSGSNHVRYKHIYYIAFSNIASQSKVNPQNKQQCKEVKDVKWFWYDDAQSMIRDYNIERKELFKRVNTMVMKFISTMSNTHVRPHVKKSQRNKEACNKTR